MAAAIHSDGNSSPVSTNQHGPNSRLQGCVQGHYQNAWCEPLHKPSVRAFEELQKLLSAKEQNGLLLDSGCGTGESTVALATMYPGNIVIGIDRSAVRLQRFAADKLATREGNCIWVRARLETFWRLMLGANWSVEKNYFLYPNPWPKSEQMIKRWHAHPSFPIVLKLCRNIELRSNWEIYAEEFSRAIEWSGGDRPKVELFNAENAISPFEKKYAASGHKLYRVRTVP